MSDDGFGCLLMSSAIFIAIIITVLQTEFDPSEIRECQAKQEWCKVQKPRLYEALYGEAE